MEYENGRNEANYQLAEAARDAVNLACERMIPVLFSRFQELLGRDRDQLEMYELSGRPTNQSVELYVAPTSVDAPVTENGAEAVTFNEALSIKLVYEPLAEGSREIDEGDVIYVYLPITRADYHYPEPLQGTGIREAAAGLPQDTATGYTERFDVDAGAYFDDDDSPTELYFEYVPNPAKGMRNARYVMQRDLADPHQRYGLFRYTVPYDGDEARVYDSFYFNLEKIQNLDRMPENSQAAIQLLDQVGNFNEVPQKLLNPRD